MTPVYIDITINIHFNLTSLTMYKSHGYRQCNRGIDCYYWKIGQCNYYHPPQDLEDLEKFRFLKPPKFKSEEDELAYIEKIKYEHDYGGFSAKSQQDFRNMVQLKKKIMKDMEMEDKNRLKTRGKSNYEVQKEWRQKQQQNRLRQQERKKMIEEKRQAQRIKIQQRRKEADRIYQMFDQLRIQISNKQKQKQKQQQKQKQKLQKIQKFRQKQINLQEQQCSICLTNYGEDNRIQKLTCGHIFHKQCIKEWLQISKNCPKCRQRDLKLQQQQQQQQKKEYYEKIKLYGFLF